VALRSRLPLAAAVVLPLALAAGCSGGTGNAAIPLPRAAASPGGAIPAGPAPGPQALSETGSTLLHPLLRSWAAAYQQQHASVSFTLGATGSGKGIAEASAGRVDIGASDAFLSSGDLITNPAMLNIPLAVSAQQVNYNVPGLRQATHLRLNGKVLAEMYQGAITSWNDPRIAALNPGVRLPHTRVVPLHRAESSGDTFLFTSYLSTQDTAWDRVRGYGTTVAWPSVPGRAPRPVTAAWWPGAWPPRAASPTSASPTLARPRTAGSATRRCGTRSAPTKRRPRKPSPPR